MSREHAIFEAAVSGNEQERIWDAFRRWGYLQANLDPLGDLEPVAMPELEVTGPEAEAARRFYCGSIGVEFMHIPDRERRLWIQERMESEAPGARSRPGFLNCWCGRRFSSRPSSRGIWEPSAFRSKEKRPLLPLLDAILSAAAEQGAEKAMLAMSHRGRLNVMVHTVGRSAAEVFARFEDVDPRSILGGGDVKYHLGATGDFHAANGATVEMHLVSNPSHLEAADPVVMGRTRAKQMRRGATGRRKVVAITMHGDAAFSGQGVWAETLNMSGLPGYDVGRRDEYHREQSDRVYDCFRATAIRRGFLRIWPSVCPCPFST